MASASISIKPVSNLKRRPIIADYTIAPDDKPSSLPKATLKAIADAKERGEYLQEVDCYWSPAEADELLAFIQNLPLASFRDYRKRHFQLNVADIPYREARIIELETIRLALIEAKTTADKAYNLAVDEARKRGVKYFDLKYDVEVKKAQDALNIANKAVDDNQSSINDFKTLINNTKEWKPERRIVVNFETNYYTTDKTIAEINKHKDKYPSLAPKIIEVINYRIVAMEEMNKSRLNPMRNIYISIVLTPMDFKADCSWNINRSGGKHDWTYTTYYLHTTEYNLADDKVVEFKSKEQMMTEVEKEEAKATAKRFAELSKTPYTDYFVIPEFTLKRHNTELDTDSLIHEEDMVENERWNKTKYNAFKHNYGICYFVIGNVNIEANTFDVLGYKTDTFKIKKCPVVINATFEPKKARAKTSPLEKELVKKNLTQNYDISELL